MRISTRYGSHLAVLIRLIPHTTGDILELGMGVFSTPYLHYCAVMQKRKLVSYDNDNGKYTEWTHRYLGQYHEIFHVQDWKDIDIEKPWGVAFIDHAPALQRKEDIRKLADYAQYIVAHDANERWEKEYEYSEIYPLFQYKRVWTDDDTHTVVLSNFNDLENLW